MSLGVDEEIRKVGHAMQRALQRRLRGKEVERASSGERSAVVAMMEELPLWFLKGHLWVFLVGVEGRRRWIEGEGCEQTACGGSMALFED